MLTKRQFIQITAIGNIVGIIRLHSVLFVSHIRTPVHSYLQTQTLSRLLKKSDSNELIEKVRDHL
jgi:hypothetical protein